MPRRQLAGSAGFVFHVMNRSAKQLTLFDNPYDYDVFLQVLADAEQKCPMRLLQYCIMPNHWHLLVWPDRDDQLPRYMRWITGVHAQRWRRLRGELGKGAVYQGRYRWVAVQNGGHFDIARQYIEQNPVRAHLVECVDEWPWSSASRQRLIVRPRLHPGPADLIANAEPCRGLLAPDVAEQMRTSLRTGEPFGEPEWNRALQVQSWLTAVLEHHSKLQKPATFKNPSKTGDF